MRDRLLDEGEVERAIKEAEPVEKYRAAFEEGIRKRVAGRKARIISDEFVHTRTQDFYRVIRTIKIEGIEKLGQGEDYCRVRKVYVININKDGSITAT